jgi:hypothetical protein
LLLDIFPPMDRLLAMRLPAALNEKDGDGADQLERWTAKED